MKETWVDIKTWEKFYQVSNLGRCRSKDRWYLHRKGVMAFLKGKILKQNKSRGYLIATFYAKENGVERTERWPVHRLVALHFIPNPENKRTVNHIDTIKDHNVVENLEWATHSEQQNHAVKMGLRLKTLGSNSNFSKLREKDVSEIRKMWATGDFFQREIAEKFGLTEEHCHRIINKKAWKHV